MINDEVFFDVLNDNILELKSDELSKVTVGAVEKIKAQHLLDNNSSLENICAVAILLAYVNDKELRQLLSDTVQKNALMIISKLDTEIPKIEYNPNYSNIQFYKWILETELNKELFHNIPLFRENIYFKDKYGVKYLLYYLLIYAFNEFDIWLKETSRNDLKYIIIEHLLNFGNFLTLTDDKFSKSQNIFIKAFHLLVTYPISNNLPTKKSNIQDILSSTLNEWEKIYILCYYIFNNYRYDENSKEVTEFLEKLKPTKILEHINIDLLNNLALNYWSYGILLQMSNYIENEKLKTQIIVWLFDKISAINFKNFYSKNMILTNVYSYILLNIEDRYKNKVEQRYTKIVKKLKMPYSFFRNFEQWNIFFTEFVFLTITLVQIAFPCKEKCSSLIKEYNNLKKSYHILNLEAYDSFIKQLEEALNKNVKTA